MAEKYGIQNYGRLLRMAKKDRDDDLRELQAKQVKWYRDDWRSNLDNDMWLKGKSKERSGRRSRDASKERRRYRSDRDSPR